MKALGGGASFKRAAMVAALLALPVVIYFQTGRFGLIALDDYDYIPNNPLVNGGLTPEGIIGAFTTAPESYWAPVLWLSYMADFSLWGKNFGAMHLVNLFFFALSVPLLFVFLEKTTKDEWRSFWAAMLWGVHPLRVESVAWVSERKDILAGFFFLLALLAYARRKENGKSGLGWPLLLFSLLGLMSKPVLVVLPVALLLIDFWPLGIMRKKGEILPLVREKGPLFGLCALFVAITLYTQLATNPWAPENTLQTAITGFGGYFKYLARTFFPSPDILLEVAGYSTTASAALGSAALTAIIGVSIAAWRFRGRVPVLLFGWLWFLLILFPNSAVVSAGLQKYADRFTYLPHIGLLAALVWLCGDSLGKRREGRVALGALAALAVALLAARSYATASYWKDSTTLFTRADEVSGWQNSLAKHSLAVECAMSGRPRKALDYFREVERLDPCYPLLNYNIALLFAANGRPEDALRQLSAKACPYDDPGGDRLALDLKRKIEESMAKGER